MNVSTVVFVEHMIRCFISSSLLIDTSVYGGAAASLFQWFVVERVCGGTDEVLKCGSVGNCSGNGVLRLIVQMFFLCIINDMFSCGVIDLCR